MIKYFIITLSTYQLFYIGYYFVQNFTKKRLLTPIFAGTIFIFPFLKLPPPKLTLMAAAATLATC